MHPAFDVPLVGRLAAYPTVIAASALAGGTIAALAVRRIADVPVWRIVVGMALLVAAGVLGARLHHALVHPQTWAEHGIVGTLLLGGRLHIAGALVACAVALPLVARALAIPGARLADAIAPAVAVVFGGARLACLLHGCCFGRPGDWPWCIRYPRGSAPFQELVEAGVLPRDAVATMPLHPLPLYFLATGLLVATWAASRARSARFEGESALGVLAALSLALASFETFRADLPGRVYWGPLPALCWTPATVGVVALVALAWMERRRTPRSNATAPAGGLASSGSGCPEA
jgi:phosphatidylglycerol---prolipoprotein diacylglyceryl transferase